MSTTARGKPMVVASPRQVRALESPVRQDIIDAFAGGGPATVAQLAAWLDRKPDTLYYHVQALRRAGLLVETGQERTGKRFAAVYDVPGRPVTIRLGAAVTPAHVSRVFRSSLRLADRDLRRALESGAGRVNGPRRNLWAGRLRGWVGPADLGRLEQLLQEVRAIVQHPSAGAPPAGGTPYSFTYAATPLAPRRVPRRTPRRAGRQPAKLKGAPR